MSTPDSEPAPGDPTIQPVNRNRSVVIAAPIRPTAGSGNDVTANRWAALLQAADHEVALLAIDEQSDEIGDYHATRLRSADVLVALHARRSAPVVGWWRRHHPDRRLIVGLSGTDLYQDMPGNAAAMASTEAADGLIVLQRAALARVERFRPGWGAKTTVIHQSVARPRPTRRPAAGELRVVVLAHLRDIKDPLLTARAARRMSPDSRVSVHHAGRALDPAWAEAADGEQRVNPRYRWHGELHRISALELLASGHLLACTSRAEGGANVVTEAIAIGLPVVGTRIEGNTGLLGDDHPGLVPVGDDEAMARLLTALESDPALLDELQRRTNQLVPITEPANEQAALVAVVEGR